MPYHITIAHYIALPSFNWSLQSIKLA